MGDTIHSENQSGGITAKNVSVGGQTNFSVTSVETKNGEKKPNWKKALAILVSTVAFLAAIAKLLDYFNIHLWGP